MRHSLLFLPLIALLGGCSNHPGGDISASGTIEATEVTVGAKVGGQIMKLLSDEGSLVKAGDTLAVIDRSDLEIQLAQAKANAAAAEAQYKLAVIGARSEDLAQAEATLKSAQDDLSRSDVLLQEHSISQKQYDDAQTRFVLAQQSYEKLKKGLRPEEIDAARARRDQAAAQVDAIRKKIVDSFVLAPMDGVVTLKVMEEGEIVLPNGSLFRISRLAQVHLIIYVSEEELASVQLGQEANVSVDGSPDRTFPGKVTYISSVAEFTPKNVQTKEDRTKLVFGVKIEVPNPESILKPGMPADAVITVGK